MPERISVISLFSIAIFAMPLSGRAEDRGDVSSTPGTPEIEGVISPYQEKSKQTLKRNGRLKGTVRYQMEHGDGNDDDAGDDEDIQGIDHPPYWVEVGRNSQGVSRWGPPKPPASSSSQEKLMPSDIQKLPPTDIGKGFVYSTDKTIYGSEGVNRPSPPPYIEFKKNNRGLTSGHARKKSKRDKTGDLKPSVNPIITAPAVTFGDEDTNYSGSSWERPEH